VEEVLKVVAILHQTTIITGTGMDINQVRQTLVAK
jgi:hypothetical protein